MGDYVLTDLFITAEDNANHNVRADDGGPLDARVNYAHNTENYSFQPIKHVIDVLKIEQIQRQDELHMAEIRVSAEKDGELLVVKNINRNPLNPDDSVQMLYVLYDEKSSVKAEGDGYSFTLVDVLIRVPYIVGGWAPLATNRHGDHGDPLVDKRRTVRFVFRQFTD